MRELQDYIFKKLSLRLLWMMACIVPFHLYAQDDDSTLIHSDAAVVSADDDDHSEKNGSKFSEEPVFRSVPDTTVARMKKEKEFAYANDPAYWVKEKKIYRKGFWDYVFGFFESNTARVIFYILLTGLIIFVLYRVIVLNELFIFYTSKKYKKILEETQTAEIEPGSIDEKIREAIDQKKYNPAVRFLYLKTLYTLNDKNQIQFHSQATNNEYLVQLSQHKKIKEFRFLTKVYEYAWYGKFEISEQQFSVVYQKFKNFQNAV